MEKKTPLYDSHVAAGGKMVPFAGYLMPIQYGTGIIAEHNAVRKEAGLFDVSHMGELELSGPDALANVNNLVTNDCAQMVVGQVTYSPFCNDEGGFIDDLLVYKKSDDCYLLVVNAANREKDYQWVKNHIQGNVVLNDQSDEVAQLALQGPKSEAILAKIAPPESIPEKYYTFVDNVLVDGKTCLVSRTGYTGEDGFEIYCKNADAAALWAKLLEVGKEDGLIPCGLGARDTLRMEAGMPLYGHEMDDDIIPKEVGLSIFVKMDKENFIGKAAIETKAPRYRRIGVKLLDRGIARDGDKVYLGDEEIGFVTSGNMSPTLGYAIAMCRVAVGKVEKGDTVFVEVRGRKLKAEVIPVTFYKRQK